MSASRRIFIPSGLRAAAPSLESSLIVQIGISSQPREHAFVQGAGEKGRLSSSRVPLVQVWGQHSTRCTSCTYPSKHKRNWAAPALLGCRFKHNGGAAWQLQIPGTSVVVATRCIERGVVLRDSVSPAHTGSKRKGGALQQGMGAAIQEKEDARVTH